MSRCLANVQVLDAKVDLLAKLIKKAKYFATYTGAGIRYMELCLLQIFSTCVIVTP